MMNSVEDYEGETENLKIDWDILNKQMVNTKLQDQLEQSVISGHEFFKSFKCKICNKVPIKPKECQNCEEIFCSDCIPKMKPVEEFDQNNLECSGCQKKFESRPINRTYMSCLLKQIKFEHKGHSEETQEIWNYEELLKHLHDCEISQIDMRCPLQCENEKLMNLKMLYEHIENECSNTEMSCKECCVGSKRKYFNRHDPNECIQNLHEQLNKKDDEIVFLKRQKTEADENRVLCPEGHRLEQRHGSSDSCGMCRGTVYDTFYYCTTCRRGICDRCQSRRALEQPRREQFMPLMRGGQRIREQAQMPREIREIACTRCTFLNRGTMRECELCQNPLQ